MNDFTKEELEILLNHMSRGANWKNELSKIDNDVMIKLESMIDNYCEHEFIVFNKEYNHVECIKCGAIE